MFTVTQYYLKKIHLSNSILSIYRKRSCLRMMLFQYNNDTNKAGSLI